ncbi:MAG: hypothetical protein ACXVPU_04800 [Bacteroidia bacterium]
METDFTKSMALKSDDELQEYIDNKLKYSPEAVFSAIEELKNRGRAFTDLEIEAIKSDIAQHQEIAKQRTAESNLNFNRWKKNVVDDLEAPQYYSEKAIYSFAVFFGVLFGSVLMAINLNNTENKKGIIEVIVFGIVFTALQIFILSAIPQNSGLTLIFSLGGAFVINNYFWKKYIGGETKYRTRPIWIPLITGILMCVIIFLGIFYL